MFECDPNHDTAHALGFIFSNKCSRFPSINHSSQQILNTALCLPGRLYSGYFSPPTGSALNPSFPTGRTRYQRNTPSSTNPSLSAAEMDFLLSKCATHCTLRSPKPPDPSSLGGSRQWRSSRPAALVLTCDR